MKKIFFTIILLSFLASISCKSDKALDENMENVLVEDTITPPTTPKLQRNILGIVLGETGPTKVRKIMQSEGLEIYQFDNNTLQGAGLFDFGGYDWDCIICKFKDDVVYSVSLCKMVKGDEYAYNANIRELKFLQDALKEKYSDYLCMSEDYMHSFYDGFTVVAAYGGNLDVKKKEANRWLSYTDDKISTEKAEEDNNQL